jgi:phosphate transport system permease protein
MQTRRKDHHSWRKFKSALISGLTFCSAVLVIAPLALVFFHVLKSGVGAINLEFFTHLPKPVGVFGGGMANAIVGTLELLALASIIGIPVGVLGGVFLAEYGTARVNAVLRFIADVLNGVPSIIWGVVVYGLIVLRFKSFSAYAGGLALGLIMIPLILRTTEEVILLVPVGYREAALALGIARWKTIVQIVVKTASRGIITGILLALGARRRRNCTASFHRIWQPLLEPRLERADCSAASANFYICNLTVRRLASSGVGWSARSRHRRFLR